MDLKVYTVYVSGLPHTVQLDEAEANRIGAKLVEPNPKPKPEKRKYTKRTDAKQAKAPLNKQVEAPDTKEG